MRTSEARDAIAAWVTEQISAGFRCDIEELNDGSTERRRRQPGLHPAYDSSRAPEVPPTVVQTQQVPAGERAGVVFTWKVESDSPPYFMVDIPTYWPRRIAAPGWALIAGRPVIDVLAWDSLQRPARVQSVRLHSYFDASIHGWRSWAENVEYSIDWKDPERPVLGGS